MSEETVKYETGQEVVYKSNRDIFEEFLARTAIDPMYIAGWKQTSNSNTIEISLSAGGKILYISE